MNRKPQPADSWWSAHAASCNGEFVKIAGDAPKEPTSKKRPLNEIGKESKTPTNTPTQKESKTETQTQTQSETEKKKPFFPAPKIYTCVNCESFRTPNLDELNRHLDSCLGNSKRNESVNKRHDKTDDSKDCNVIDLTKE